MRLTTAVVLLLSCSITQVRAFADVVTQTTVLEKEGLAVELASSQQAAAEAAQVVQEAPAVEEPMGAAAVGLRASGIRRGQDAPVTVARKLTKDEEMAKLAADLKELQALEEKEGQLRGNEAMKPLPKGAVRVKHDNRKPEAPDDKMLVPRKPAGLKPIDEILHSMVDTNTLDNLNLKLDHDGKAVKPTLPPAADQADELAYYKKMAAFYAVEAVIDGVDVEVPLDENGLPVMPPMPTGPVDSRTKTAYDKAVAAYYTKMANIDKDKVDPELAAKMGWKSPSGEGT